MAGCFFQVSHPGPCRVHILLEQERKRCAWFDNVNSAWYLILLWLHFSWSLPCFFFFPLGLLRDLLYHYITPQCCSKVIWADCWSSGVGVCSSPEQSQLTLPTVNVDWNLCSTDLCSVLQVLWKRVVTKGAFHCETHLKRSWRYAVMPSRELDFSKNTIDEKQFVNKKKKKLGRYIRAENGFWMNTKTNKEYIE